MGRPKLLVLTADYPPRAWSGIAYAVACEAEALVAEGATVHVLTRRAAPRISPAGPRVRSSSSRTFPWADVRFHCVHLHSLGFAPLAFEIRRRSGARLVYTAHSSLDCELREPDQRRHWWGLQRAVMQASDAVIFLSATERTRAVSLVPDLAGKSHVIPNALPPPPPRRHPYDPSGPIVYAGRFTRTKGVDLIAALVPELVAVRGGRFVVAGGHGDEDGHQMVTQLRRDVGDAVVAPGWLSREALDELFASAAAVLVPSAYEPFGLVALEAMRMGAPVLAAYEGGLAANITPESGGRLIASRDPRVWSRAVLDVLADRPSAEALARRGPAYVAARFGPPSHARRLLHDVYGQAADSSGSRPATVGVCACG